ncbi:uncharacterized protein LOC141533035 [Cotesia typhae]|uniref:uncharacterized protein LOC141533035 n=1 Tax=Cotesia typhae TaxID=2053667 RepID=UPI003D687370
MRRFANDCGAEMPSALRGTNLRKHVATYTSLLNVEDCQINKLANFMGHAKEIHKSYYQIPVPVTEITEVSKMLLAALGNDDDNTYDPNDVSEDENSDSSDDDDDADENISRTDAPSLTDNQTSDDNNSSSGESKVNKSKRFKPSKILRRRRTNEENKILEKKFGKLCKMVTLPSVKQCVAIIKENDVLKSRTAAQIRSHIQNLKQRSH